MDESRDRGRRVPTRVWLADQRREPVAQVRDEAVRAVLLTRRRALLMEAREIARRCGLDPDTPDDAAA